MPGAGGDTPAGGSALRRRGLVLELLVALAAFCLLAVPSGLARTQDGVISITSGPSGETTAREATFTFESAPDVTVGYTTCRLDSGDESTCTSPASYTGLGLGAHRFLVRAYSSRGGLLGSDSRSWTVVEPSPPPPPPPPPPPGPTPPPPIVAPDPVLPVLPDFFLAATPYTGPGLKKPVKTVVLKPGAKGSALVAVVRIGASKGSFSFSFSPLAPGVTAGISQDSVANPAQVTVHLFASYSAKPVAGKVTLTAKPSSPLVGPGPRSIEIPYLVLEQYDLAIAGIDVTQGIQLPQSAASALPARDPAKAGAAVPYPPAVKLALTPTGLTSFALQPLTGAAPLVQRKRTTVSVFAVAVGPAGAGITGATVLLHGRSKDGAPLPYSPLKSQNAPSLSVGDPNAVPLPWLQKKKNAFTFTLPSTWTDRAWIELEAELLPPILYGKAECTLAACLENNRFRLTNVVLHDTGYVEVWPLGFVSLKEGDAKLDGPGEVFGQTARALPLDEDELRVSGEYRAYYDATNITNQNTLLATVKAFVNDLPSACSSWFVPFRAAGCPDLVAGVRAGGIAGISAGGASVLPPRPGITVVNQFRPLTSVAHETGHALGFRHADTGCGGGSDGQKAEVWWPDPWGLLYGITGAGKVNGAGNVGTAGVKTSASWYDFMSYCADNSQDDDSWISLVNYRRAFDVIATLQKARMGSLLARVSQTGQPAVLSVIGYVDGDAAVVTRIRAKAGDPAVGPPDSPYRLVLRDSVGRVLAEAPMRVETTDGHGAEETFLSADVPLPDAEPGALPAALFAVEVVSGGAVRGRVTRSANAPTATVLAPAKDARVGGPGGVAVRWRSSDADGDTLTAALDYSTDDGRTWRPVFSGPDRGQTLLPSRLLTASRQARLRVRVSDGFDETSRLSERFVALGAPPVVEIIDPDRPRVVLGAAEVLSLAARAYDDAFQPLRGRALTWLDSGRRIATGDAASVFPLAPGLHRIRVVARDRAGRTATDSVLVRVRADAPRLIVRGAPARLSPRAKALRLSVTTTLPATLTAAGPSLRGPSPRWTIGARARTIVIPVRPARGPARIVLRATAYGKASTLRLTLARSR